MNLNNIIIQILVITLLSSCVDYRTDNKIHKKDKQYYVSSGFALIYDDNYYIQKVVNKKINNENLEVMHSLLKRNTPIKIINPDNSKVVETKVSKKGNYPKIFKVVISKEIASLLELDISNPYVEVNEIKKNKIFIAKEGNIFEEEKNVAEKAPVNEVKMDDLSKEKTKTEKKIKKNKDFILVISDFYYKDSAYSLMDDLFKKTKINNISVKKINDKKYRLLVGPFKNFNTLKKTYISLNNLGFENLNVYRE